VLLNDYAEVLFATNEFEKLWAEGVDILPSIAQQSLEKTHLSDNITPYELYLKCLIEYFGEEIEFDPNSIKDLPQGFKRLSYQSPASVKLEDPVMTLLVVCSLKLSGRKI
jgi:hypothetical protein